MSRARVILNGLNNRVYVEDAAAHDWYRFVLSYPPHLVRDYIQRFGLSSEHRVLDPFCGAGTTLVECKKLGIESVGIEAHPMSHFASQVKVDWTPAPDALIEHAEAIASATRQKLEAEGIADDPQPFSVGEGAKSYRALPEESMKLLLTDSIGPLPLHKTLVLLEVIREQRDERYLRHELLALAKALVFSVSNLHFGLEVGVSKTKKLDAAVVSMWLDNVRAMANDLRELRSLRETRCRRAKTRRRRIVTRRLSSASSSIITQRARPKSASSEKRLSVSRKSFTSSCRRISATSFTAFAIASRSLSQSGRKRLKAGSGLFDPQGARATASCSSTNRTSRRLR